MFKRVKEISTKPFFHSRQKWASIQYSCTFVFIVENVHLKQRMFFLNKWMGYDATSWSLSIFGYFCWNSQRPGSGGRLFGFFDCGHAKIIWTCSVSSFFVFKASSLLLSLCFPRLNEGGELPDPSAASLCVFWIQPGRVFPRHSLISGALALQRTPIIPFLTPRTSSQSPSLI